MLEPAGLDVPAADVPSVLRSHFGSHPEGTRAQSRPTVIRSVTQVKSTSGFGQSVPRGVLEFRSIGGVDESETLEPAYARSRHTQKQATPQKASPVHLGPSGLAKGQTAPVAGLQAALKVSNLDELGSHVSISPSEEIAHWCISASAKQSTLDLRPKMGRPVVTQRTTYSGHLADGLRGSCSPAKTIARIQVKDARPKSSLKSKDLPLFNDEPVEERSFKPPLRDCIPAAASTSGPLVGLSPPASQVKCVSSSSSRPLRRDRIASRAIGAIWSGSSTPAPHAGYVCPVCQAGGLESFSVAVAHCGGPGIRVWQSHEADLEAENGRFVQPVHLDLAGNVPSGEETSSTRSSEHDVAPFFARKYGQAATPLPPQGLRESVGTPAAPTTPTSAMKRPRVRSESLDAPTPTVACGSNYSPQDAMAEDAHAFRRVPSGGDVLPTAVHPPKAYGPQTPVNRPTSTEVPLEPLPDLAGQPVAYDNTGRVMIARQIHPETGKARTVVVSSDGSQQIFGETTVASLLKSNEEHMSKFMDKLSDVQMRGLVHEVGQRLLQDSGTYQAVAAEWEALTKQDNYKYFGISEFATEKELDIAYRKLAKQMHPDKNGGTEEAKRRFQQMKERYEALKEEIRNDPAKHGGDRAKSGKGEDAEDEESADATPTAPKAVEDGEGPPMQQTSSKEEADGEEEKTQEKEKSIKYDPHDRSSMEETARKMLRQLRVMRTTMVQIKQELRKIKEHSGDDVAKDGS